MNQLLKVAIWLLLSTVCFSQTMQDFEENRIKEEKKEFRFIGYYFMRSEISNAFPTNEFLKGR
jgi:hypothetical protein